MPIAKAHTSSKPAAGAAIPLSEPCLGAQEQANVAECFATNLVSSVGPFVGRLERLMADAVGARHAVATINGTAALHLALLVAGVEPEDEVLVPALTFIAPVNAVRYAGAWPVVIDAEPEHWQMDPAAVERFCAEACRPEPGALRNRATGRRVRAMVPVHVLGHPCDMDRLLAVARRFHLAVIEDATESLGAEYRGRPAGHAGDIACFSFNGNKVITTGGGGMLLTDDAEAARRARYLSTQAKDDPEEYVHGAIGFNYRLSNLLAAVGCAQMERLASHVAAKRRIAYRYAEGLRGVPGAALMAEASWATSSWWLSTVTVDASRFGRDARALRRGLAEAGIDSRPLWHPVPRNPAYGWLPAECPVADRIAGSALSLPSSVGLTPQDQDRVIGAVRALGVRG